MTNVSMLTIIDPRVGNETITWDPSDAKQVAAVRETFDQMMVKNFSAYEQQGHGGGAVAVKEFNPEADTIIATVPVVAG